MNDILGRKKQEWLTRPQMLALAFKRDHQKASNGEIAKIAGVSSEIVRQWFALNGKSIVSECWRCYQASGEIFPPLEFKSPAAKVRHEKNMARLRGINTGALRAMIPPPEAAPYEAFEHDYFHPEKNVKPAVIVPADDDDELPPSGGERLKPKVEISRRREIVAAEEKPSGGLMSPEEKQRTMAVNAADLRKWPSLESLTKKPRYDGLAPDSTVGPG